MRHFTEDVGELTGRACCAPPSIYLSPGGPIRRGSQSSVDPSAPPCPSMMKELRAASCELLGLGIRRCSLYLLAHRQGSLVPQRSGSGVGGWYGMVWVVWSGTDKVVPFRPTQCPQSQSEVGRLALQVTLLGWSSQDDLAINEPLLSLSPHLLSFALSTLASTPANASMRRKQHTPGDYGRLHSLKGRLSAMLFPKAARSPMGCVDGNAMSITIKFQRGRYLVTRVSHIPSLVQTWSGLSSQD